tara:strand:+ start:216 stop:548 length:333 start_codon:yes stop_codon:yes gene_type:complete
MKKLNKECLFCFEEFKESNLIQLKCNCYDYYYCYDCLLNWEQKKGKICPVSWCKKEYKEEYFFFKKLLNYTFNNLIIIMFKIFSFLCLINLLISQFKYLNNNLNSYINKE